MDVKNTLLTIGSNPNASIQITDYRANAGAGAAVMLYIKNQAD